MPRSIDELDAEAVVVAREPRDLGYPLTPWESASGAVETAAGVGQSVSPSTVTSAEANAIAARKLTPHQCTPPGLTR